MAQLRVEVVAPERQLWSGDATMVVARTTEGEIGIMAGHVPVLGVLVEGGIVEVVQDRDRQRIAVHGGFLQVSDNTVRILAEDAQLGDEIDVEAVRSQLSAAESGTDADSEARARRARSQLRAAGQPS